MSHEERDNSGSLFRVTEKKGDKFPDWEGKGIVAGRKVWISGWIKEGAKGKFYSLSFKDRDDKAGGQKQSRKQEDDSDIPW